MKIIDRLNEDNIHISFEVFPPKQEDAYEAVEHAVTEIAKLSPSFMSVTYGAGGGTSRYTAKIASGLLKNYGVTALAHLSCVTSTKDQVREAAGTLKTRGIENILALRGDIPADGRIETDYHYACELVRDLKQMGDFCIGGACYPEGHPESPGKEQDILYLKEKVEAGCDFLTTQMFFDNNILYNFLYRIREKGITVPVIAGIMPVTNKKQMKRICDMSGTVLPQRFLDVLDRFGDDPAAMQQAGIAYATDQIIDLFANGINHVHVYSMNKPEVAAAIMNNLSAIMKH